MSLQEEHRPQIDLEPHMEMLEQALAGLPAGVQAILLHERLAAIGVDYSEPLEPSAVEAAFEGLIEQEKTEREGRPGPKPVRVARVWEVFQGRENEAVPIEYFEAKWPTSPTKARNSAQSALSKVGRELRRFGYTIVPIKEGYTTVAYQLARLIISHG